MKAFFVRLGFLLRYRTLKKIIVHPGNVHKIIVCHRGKISTIQRRCPHQGALLETGYFEGDHLLCPWHGCKFLKGEA